MHFNEIIMDPLTLVKRCILAHSHLTNTPAVSECLKKGVLLHFRQKKTGYYVTSHSFSFPKRLDNTVKGSRQTKKT